MTHLLAPPRPASYAGVVAIAKLAAVVAAVTAAATPAPSAPLPRSPAPVVRALIATDASLRAAFRNWHPRTAVPPPGVTLHALYEQRLYRLLSRDVALWRAAVRRLPRRLADHARDLVVAHRELVRITPPLRTRAPRVGRAAPPDRLLRWYREAARRFRVPWHVLAAVNFVESAFGKLRSTSAAGAQGPMQFMPSTWREYGLGGNVHDPHDAILGAANYLHAAGAPGDIGRALYAYNPSPYYVDAVLRYARQIHRDAHVFFELYSWQVFVRTAAGERRVTGPGLD